MKRRTRDFGWWAGVLFALIFLMSGLSYGGDGVYETRVPKGVYIDLTKDFYEALRDEGSRGTKVYGTDLSSEYLRQIAVSARFMVETNLQILRLQEEIIRLIDAQSGNHKK